MRRFTRWSTALALSLNLVACAGEEPGLEDVDLEDELADDGKYEAWNTANNPGYVDSTFIYEVDQLPVEGKPSRMPWSGDYWATYADNLNHRWDGESSLSPAEKIEQGLGKSGFSKAITDNFGIYSTGTKACNTDADCASEDDGSSCVTPRGASGDKAGRCIPGWWGICHGWAPAAVATPAPVKPIVRNGVTFYPGDMEGIISLIYAENLPTKFLSQRCNKKDLGTDNSGRPRDGECRDMNPGALYVVAANMIGKRGMSFVEDRTANYEVWNQPVAGYKVTNAEGGKLKEVSKAEALALLGADKTFTSLLGDTELKKGEQKAGEHTAAAAGTITIRLQGTGDADLYVKKGSAPTTSSYDCRPYAGSSDEECNVNVAAGEKVYWMIDGYAETSKVSLSVGTVAGGGTYTYNPAATRFFYVEMDFSYITESRPARTSHYPNIEQYIRTDHYQFILETNDAGRILGGEWVGSSRLNHPDFIWWPTGNPYGTIAGGLSYNEIKGMIDEAAGAPTGPTTSKLFDNVTVKNSTSKYATIGVPAGKTLKLTMTGTGNADLYVKMGRKPTVYNYDKASTGPTSEETITITAPGAGGTYYVRVRPMGGTSTVTVTATIE